MPDPGATLVPDTRQQNISSNVESLADHGCTLRVEKSMQATSLEDSSSLQFPRFSELPYELRRDIWLCAHPGPQYVILHNHPSRCSPFKPHIRSPFAQLLTNHEARTLLMESYTHMFKGFPGVEPERGWYFNPRRDTLCLKTGLQGLRRLLQNLPDEIKTLRYLDVNAPIVDARYRFIDDYTPLINARLKLLTIRNFSIDRHPTSWRPFKEVTLFLTRVLQHEKNVDCEEGKCTRLAIRFDHDNDDYNDDECWERQTFCKIHDEGKPDKHTCIDFEFLAESPNPTSGPWHRSTAKGFDVHLPETHDDRTLPPGTREIDLHKYTASDGSVLPIPANWAALLSPD